MLKTFRLGGIRLKSNNLLMGKETQTVLPSGRIVIPLNQHVGAPCQPIVKRGDKVKVGTLIGKRVGFVSANIHSSVSGTVAKIDKISGINDHKSDAVVINVEGDEWEGRIDRSEKLCEECLFSPEEIIDKIALAGVVGMGATPFPTHVKLAAPPGTKIETLIVSAVESDLYTAANHVLMLEKTREILVGVAILMKATGANRAILAIENDKKDAVDKFTPFLKLYANIEMVLLKPKYPQGNEKLLIDAVMGLQIPSGKLPVSEGIVVENVATVFAVYEAVQKNKPLVERMITVAGKNGEGACNIRSRIGMPIGTLIDVAGGLPQKNNTVVLGGPMMGKVLNDLNSPLIKEIPGILLLPHLEVRRGNLKPCVRCAKCVEACPMGLNPAFLMDFVRKKLWGKAEEWGIGDCIECGLCSYVCPSDLPLVKYLQAGKAEVSSIIRKRRD